MVGILTFYWADNYGAMLQAYALKKYLEKSGYDVEIIPYAPLYLRGGFYLIPILADREGNRIKYHSNHRMIQKNLSLGRTFWRRRKNMSCFRLQHLTNKKAIRKSSRLSLRKYSCVFVGSDQVWNPELTAGLDDAYLGNIEDKGNCRLIAYGASFGGERPDEEISKKLIKAIHDNFAEISLRERSAADYLGELLHRRIADVLDPTLLLEKEEWIHMGKQPEEKDYIMVSYTEDNIEMTQYVKELAELSQKKIIQVTPPLEKKTEEGFVLRAEGGPAEFIGYITNACCVVTNSFHGAVFSILLERPFMVFKHSSRNARLQNLLEKLTLEQRLVKPDTMVNLSCMEEVIDWQAVRKHLWEERKQSERFIREEMERKNDKKHGRCSGEPWV